MDQQRDDDERLDLALAAALDELPERERAAISLHYLGGKTLAETRFDDWLSQSLTAQPR